jgi:hypothetical protein
MAYSLDDTWDNCGPVARAGNAAFGVYCRCGIWVARNLTDGFAGVGPQARGCRSLGGR